MTAWSERLQAAWLARGPLAIALLPVAALYGAVVAVRRRLYAAGWLPVVKLPVPVVVVGNLVVGGAGKTPTVIATVTALRRHGWRPGIVSRGYRGHATGVLAVAPDTDPRVCGDEPKLLRLRTGVPVFVGVDRPAAALALLSRHPEVDVVVADDGLQHLALARDVELRVFDERGAGNGWLLPAGPLREPMPRHPPRRGLTVYNGTEPSTPWPGWHGERRLAGVLRHEDWRAGRGDALEPWTALGDRPVLAAAGIARPERFFGMLRAAGLRIEPLPLPDHHDYADPPWPAGTPEVIVTEKDAIKLDPTRLGATRVWVAPLDFSIEAPFETALLALLPTRPTARHGNPPA